MLTVEIPGYLPEQVHHYDGQCNQEPMQQLPLHLKIISLCSIRSNEAKPGSNSSRQMTRASRDPQSTTALAKSGECFATARSTNAAAFL